MKSMIAKHSGSEERPEQESLGETPFLHPDEAARVEQELEAYLAANLAGT